MRIARFRLDSTTALLAALLLGLVLVSCTGRVSPPPETTSEEEATAVGEVEEATATPLLEIFAPEDEATPTPFGAMGPEEAETPAVEEGAAPATTPAATTPITSEQSTSHDEAGVLAVLDVWIKAVTTTDPTTVASLYSEDAVLWDALSPSMNTGREEIQEAFNRFMSLENLNVLYYGSDVRVYGDMAINSGYYTFFYVQDGQMTSLPARYTFVYRWNAESGWVIVEHHSSVMPGVATGE